MTVAIIVVIAVVLVLVLGLLIFRLLRSTQATVPRMTDESRPTGALVVGHDEQGEEITEAQEPQAAARDDNAFESLLQDEIRDRGMEQPRPDDEA